MISPLWNAVVRCASLRAFYFVWTRTSAATIGLWLVFSGDDSWLATAGLTVLLISLLVGGVFLLLLGIRDLIRDFRRFLQARSHKNGHVPL
jgi:hypothetical protein